MSGAKLAGLKAALLVVDDLHHPVRLGGPGRTALDTMHAFRRPKVIHRMIQV